MMRSRWAWGPLERSIGAEGVRQACCESGKGEKVLTGRDRPLTCEIGRDDFAFGVNHGPRHDFGLAKLRRRLTAVYDAVHGAARTRRVHVRPAACVRERDRAGADPRGEGVLRNERVGVEGVVGRVGVLHIRHDAS